LVGKNTLLTYVPQIPPWHTTGWSRLEPPVVWMIVPGELMVTPFNVVEVWFSRKKNESNVPLKPAPLNEPFVTSRTEDEYDVASATSGVNARATMASTANTLNPRITHLPINWNRIREG